jgi:hypothetical protein
MTSHGVNNDVYMSQAIIPPPEDLINKFSTKHIIVDSRDRNRHKYPNPSKYSIAFDEPFDNVHSVELTVYDFPFNEYNITEFNNVLHVNEEDHKIPAGKYTESELVVALNSSLYGIMTFDYDEKKRQIKINPTGTDRVEIKCKSDDKPITVPIYFNNPTIPGTKTATKPDGEPSEAYQPNNPLGPQTGTETYNIPIHTYRENTIAQVLGFDAIDYEVTTDTECPFPVNLNARPNYIIMYLGRTKLYFSQNNNAHQSFAIIRPSNKENIVKLGNELITKVYNPPIDLKKMDFKFVDYNGRLYDFQNQEHSFELKVKCFKQTPKYNNIFK